MIIGVPKEIKNNENRVSITPAGVNSLVKSNHTVLIEKSAGIGSGIKDEDYKQAGAIIREKKNRSSDRSCISTWRKGSKNRNGKNG